MKNNQNEYAIKGLQTIIGQGKLTKKSTKLKKIPHPMSLTRNQSSNLLIQIPIEDSNKLDMNKHFIDCMNIFWGNLRKNNNKYK